MTCDLQKKPAGQHDFVQEESFICFLSVNAGFESVVDFDDFHANEWQSIVGCYYHRKLNGGVGFIKTYQQISGVGEVAYQSLML